ncbi:MAG: SUMF1/EgtB/PvdO family nonheme iron enzyme [Polyangiaceae bacterium]
MSRLTLAALAFIVPVASTAALASSCSSSTPNDTTPRATATAQASASASASAEPTASASVEPTASASASVATAPEACPEGMVLVDGDYCSEVQHTCLKEWWAEANKKRVCELFEEKSTCTGTKTHKRYCIDKYEWPNKVGERPEVMNRFYQAEVKCAAVGKRMCTESEWNLACEGPEMKPFPYGYKRNPWVCNGDQPWDNPNMKKVDARDATELGRLWKGMRSGTQPDCKSDYGVFDMPGNADEVVASEQNPTDKHGEFDSVHTGGPWYAGVRNQCRPKVYTHGEDFYYYYLSFRCCAEPDGKETDPRTPRQIAAKWDMSKVEWHAQFTVAEMKEKLRLKEEGKCECKDTDVLCKTMCGSLLGPNAVDTTPDAPRVRYAGKRLKGSMKD